MAGRIRFWGVLFVLLIASAFVYAQETVSSKDKIDFGFIPGESSRQLARMKAGSLERQFDTEKSLLPQIQSEMDKYDVTYYDIHWRPDFSDSTIYGEVTIYARSLDPALNKPLVLLDESMHVDSVYNDYGMRPCTHTAGFLYVYLERDYGPGEEFNFTVRYHGQPSLNLLIFEGLIFSTHSGVPIVENLSEPYGARGWWPCKDVVWDKADSVDVRITADNGMTATSNGLLISDIDNGDGTHTAHWRHRYPITTYNVCIAVTNYVSETDYYVYSPTDSMPIVNYILPEYAGDELIAYDVSAQALAVFAGLFVEYPFINEKFGHSMCRIHGMEHQTNTFLNYRLSCDEPTVVHELAHHWWGNLVTCKSWEHVWLNEGIGTYCEPLFYEALYGPEYLQAYMEGLRYLDSGTVYVSNVSDPWVIFDIRSYWKGAWVTHMLRGVVGDSAFFEGMRQYANTFAYGHADSDDLKEVMEANSGQDLDYFFQEWLFGQYYPNYRYAYLIEDNAGGGSDVYLYVRQRQTTDPEVFAMPISIHLVTDTGEVVTQVFNDRREQNFVISTDYEVDYIEFDPDEWILKNAMGEEYHVHIVTDELTPPAQAEWYCDTVVAKGGSGLFTYDLVSGIMPEGWDLDETSGIISGYSLENGTFTFMVKATDVVYPLNYYDSLAYTVTMGAPLPRPGDANADLDVNVGDAVFLINYIFKGGSAPCILNWADVNLDCQVNVGDAVFLINFVFKGGAAPKLGCME